MLIRREGAGDAAVIRAVTAAAFARPAEAVLVDELRAVRPGVTRVVP